METLPKIKITTTAIDKLALLIEDLLLIQESHLRNKGKFYLPNFDCFGNDRSNPLCVRATGGTAIFMKSHLPYHHIPTRPLQHIEPTIISLNLPNLDPIITASICVPVTSDPQLLTLNLDSIMQLGSNIIMRGDFNAHHQVWKCLFPYYITSLSELSSDLNPVEFSFKFNYILPPDNSDINTNWTLFTNLLIEKHAHPLPIINYSNTLNLEIHNFTDDILAAHKNANKHLAFNVFALFKLDGLQPLTHHGQYPKRTEIWGFEHTRNPHISVRFGMRARPTSAHARR
ncbi:putative RNA-directed DNA polymerase from transposon X-element [Caerostris darwini]|uniref:RNA-directed DNA polymerase from transposon X-element n=1 Tax=Caerostris darwini TaxID=1538125 RepID=A0AAV4PKN4_9ARAC|nr:putative RNA-directed DNA polymerase from transposon X-element [Caerostris darwini]